MTDGIKIVTLNTRGLRNTTKMKEVLIWLHLKEAKLYFSKKRIPPLSQNMPGGKNGLDYYSFPMVLTIRKALVYLSINQYH